MINLIIIIFIGGIVYLSINNILSKTSCIKCNYCGGDCKFLCNPLNSNNCKNKRYRFY